MKSKNANCIVDQVVGVQVIAENTEDLIHHLRRCHGIKLTRDFLNVSPDITVKRFILFQVILDGEIICEVELV